MRSPLAKLGPLSFYRTALSIALPVMLQQLIMSMVSLIDNFMVAGLGDISMAAVNVANQINFIYIVLINAICGAGGIYLSQFNGAKDPEGMKHAYRFKVILAFAVSAVYFALCWIIPEQMLSLMLHGNASRDEISAIGVRYLRLISFTLIPMTISTAIGTSFREIGQPRIPLIFSAAATLVNTLGNWILIYGNLGAPRLEVTGAAIATIIARFVELALFLWYTKGISLVHVPGQTRGQFFKFAIKRTQTNRAPFYVPFLQLHRVNRRLIREILGKSGMMFLSDISFAVSETIMIALYNGRGGAEVVAGMAAGWAIANIFFLFFSGIQTTATVLVGGSLGAGMLDQGRQRAGWITSGSVVMGFAMMLAGAGLSSLIIPLVYANLTAEARSICLGLVSVILVYMPLWSVLNCQFAISRAGGDTALGMYTDVSVNTLIFLPAAFILAFFTTLSPVVMFAILKTTDVIKYFIARYLYKKEKWIRNLTIREPNPK